MRVVLVAAMAAVVVVVVVVVVQMRHQRYQAQIQRLAEPEPVVAAQLQS